MKLREIAERIDTHLKRLEADKEWNRAFYGSKRLWHPRAFASGAWLIIWYTSYQTWSSLRKADALRYLEWLEGGNNGTHFEAFREVSA